MSGGFQQAKYRDAVLLQGSQGGLFSGRIVMPQGEDSRFEPITIQQARQADGERLCSAGLITQGNAGYNLKYSNARQVSLL